MTDKKILRLTTFDHEQRSKSAIVDLKFFLLDSLRDAACRAQALPHGSYTPEVTGLQQSRDQIPLDLPWRRRFLRPSQAEH